MARTFNGTTQYLSSGSAVLTGEPLTMACWFNPSAVTAAMTILALGNNGTSGFFRIALDGATANDPLLAQKQNDAGTAVVSTIDTSVTVGTWHHAAAVFTSTTSRTAYYDGTAATENTTSNTTITPDFTSVGALRRSTVSSYFAGSVAEAAIWNVALTANEIATLAKGYASRFVRPSALVALWPLMARATDEEDWAGAFPLTNTNSATRAAHPNRIIYPVRNRIILPAAAAGGGFQAAWAVNSNVLIQSGIRG